MAALYATFHTPLGIFEGLQIFDNESMTVKEVEAYAINYAINMRTSLDYLTGTAPWDKKYPNGKKISFRADILKQSIIEWYIV